MKKPSIKPTTMSMTVHPHYRKQTKTATLPIYVLKSMEFKEENNLLVSVQIEDIAKLYVTLSNPVIEIWKDGIMISIFKEPLRDAFKVSQEVMHQSRID